MASGFDVVVSRINRTLTVGSLLGIGNTTPICGGVCFGGGGGVPSQAQSVSVPSSAKTLSHSGRICESVQQTQFEPKTREAFLDLIKTGSTKVLDTHELSLSTCCQITNGVNAKHLQRLASTNRKV